MPNQPTLTGAILAGGRARRMGGEDKGLILLGGRPLIEHVIERLAPQVDRLLINANHNVATYSRYGYPVISDELEGYPGPLAGMAAVLSAATSELVLIVPCDVPGLPPDLARRLIDGLHQHDTSISVAHDGQRMQQAIVLLRRRVLPQLETHLKQGGRRVESWIRQHDPALVDFSDQIECFHNINTPGDLEQVGMLTHNVQNKID